MNVHAPAATRDRIKLKNLAKSPARRYQPSAAAALPVRASWPIAPTGAEEHGRGLLLISEQLSFTPLDNGQPSTLVFTHTAETMTVMIAHFALPWNTTLVLLNDEQQPGPVRLHMSARAGQRFLRILPPGIIAHTSTLWRLPA